MHGAVEGTARAPQLRCNKARCNLLQRRPFLALSVSFGVKDSDAGGKGCTTADEMRDPESEREGRYLDATGRPNASTLPIARGFLLFAACSEAYD